MILGREIYAMLDTGATLSVISLETINFLKMHDQIETTHEILKGPSGEKLSAVGKIKISFKIKNFRNFIFTVSFIVVKNLQFHILLGIEFVRNNNLDLSFKENILKFKNVSSPLYFLSQTPNLKENLTLSITKS